MCFGWLFLWASSAVLLLYFFICYCFFFLLINPLANGGGEPASLEVALDGIHKQDTNKKEWLHRPATEACGHRPRNLALKKKIDLCLMHSTGEITTRFTATSPLSGGGANAWSPRSTVGGESSRCLVRGRDPRARPPACGTRPSPSPCQSRLIVKGAQKDKER